MKFSYVMQQRGWHGSLSVVPIVSAVPKSSCGSPASRAPPPKIQVLSCTTCLGELGHVGNLHIGPHFCAGHHVVAVQQAVHSDHILILRPELTPQQIALLLPVAWS